MSTFCRSVLLALIAFDLIVNAAAAQKKSTPSRWEATIAKFEAQDKNSPPPEGGILFVGSSSIRMWKLDQWFPNLRANNRGFGGSEIADSIQFADRIILRYKPKVIVLYAGDNDIGRGKSPDVVVEDFQKFVKAVRPTLPRTRIVFIAIKPSIARWKLVDKMREANRRIQKLTQDDKLLEFVDVDTPMIGDDGRPRKELFLKDGLHMNDEGYRLWTKLVGPHLIDAGSAE
jgi:lysophospholipase L1-like esterase